MEESQELKNNNDPLLSLENISGIQFIFCKPYNETYYTYSVNSIENSHLITRFNLVELISKISPIHGYTVRYNTEHFYTFIFDKEKNEILKLEINQEDDKIKDLLLQKQNEEIKLKVIQEDLHKENPTKKLENKLKSLYDKLFIQKVRY